LGGFRVRWELARGTRGFLSPKPGFSRTGNIHTSPPRYDGLINLRHCFTCCIIDGGRISVGLTPLSIRPRHPTISDTPARVCRRRSTRRTTTHPGTHIVFLQTDHYRTRVHHRDPCCLISGLMVVRGDYSRFKAAHIYPRAHDDEVRPSRLFYSHLANISYLVDPEGLSKSYHRSCTSCRTGRINQD
jgi:hypothetical protein